jgi:hypothetical protein
MNKCIREVSVSRTGLEVLRELTEEQLGEHTAVGAVLAIDINVVVAPCGEVEGYPVMSSSLVDSDWLLTSHLGCEVPVGTSEDHGCMEN